MSNKILFFALSFILFACKDENAYLEGNVLEEAYTIPISKAEVRITSTTYGGDLTYVASSTTDADGHFRINYHKKGPFTKYEVAITSGKIFSNDYSGLSSKKVNKDFILTPLSQAKFRIKNKQSNDIDVSITSLDNFRNLLGLKIKKNSDTLIPLALNVKGFGITHLSFSVTLMPSQNSTTVFKDSISIFTKTDTIIHLIEIN